MVLHCLQQRNREILTNEKFRGGRAADPPIGRKLSVTITEHLHPICDTIIAAENFVWQGLCVFGDDSD